jgi:hypothetical protein
MAERGSFLDGRLWTVWGMLGPTPGHLIDCSVVSPFGTVGPRAASRYHLLNENEVGSLAKNFSGTILGGWSGR